MKNRVYLFLLAILCLIQLSCNNANDTLIGEWLRSDFNTNSEYKLTFEENNTGYIVNQETTEEGIISNIVSIDWKVTNDILTISQDNEDLATSIQFTANGNLILADFSTFDFIKQ